MHTTTPMYQYLMALPSRTLTTRGLITYPDTNTQELTAEYISSWRINENAGANLPIGGVGSASLELKLDNRGGEWNPGGPILGAHDLDGAIISLELGAYDPEYAPPYPSVDGGTPSATSGSYDGGAPDEVFSEYLDGGEPMMFPFYETHWSNVGTYVAEASIGQEQEPLLTIKAQDYLANYGSALFTDGLTYPKTVIQILTEACSQAGIVLNSSSFTNSTRFIAAKPVWPDGTVCRDVISYVACIAAGFAYINRNGELEIVGFDDSSDYALTTTRYKTLESREKYGAFNSVTAESYDTRAETRVEVAGGITDNEHNSILIRGNPLIGSTEIATILAGMLTALGGLTFDSAKLDWQGDPTVTLGDVLGVTDKGSNAYVVPVYKQTLTFDSGFGMSSENDIGTITRKSSNLSRLFTSSGRLNSLALEGDIKIRAGENIHVLAGGNINMTATNQLVFTGGSTLADMLGASGIQSYTGSTAPASPNTGDLWFDTGNFNVCKRWNGSSWTEYTQGKLSNSKMTLDATGISLLSGGTFTVASTNFMIDSSGNVSMKGAVTANTGYIGGTGGFTIQSAKLYSGKSTLDSTTAGVYIGTDGISLGGSGVAPPFKVTSAGALTATSGVIGDFTLSGGHIYYGAPTGGGWFTDFSKWGLAVGQDRSYPNNHFPVRLTSHQDGSYGYFMATAGNVGVLAFSENALSVYSYTSDNIYTGMATRTKKVHITASNGHIQTKGSISLEGNVDCVGIVTSEDWVDFTPGYKGASAVAELRGVRNNEKGDIDHATLPLSARKKVKLHRKLDDEVRKGEDAEFEKEEVDGRSIGMMVSILTKAIQELDERLDKLEARNGQRI